MDGKTMKKKMIVNVFDHEEIVERPATIREHVTIYKDVEKEVDICDACKEKQASYVCIGCNLAYCNDCSQGSNQMHHIEVETGTCYLDEQSDGYDFESFYICSNCKNNPPDKIQFYRRMKDIVDLDRQITDIQLGMISEIRKLKGENS